MKKKILLPLLLAGLILAGCSHAKSEYHEKSGDLTSFQLLTPNNESRCSGTISFTWEEVPNATSYSIEISWREDFYNDPNQVYLKESNIAQPKYDLTYSLPKKDINYWWRVTAENKDHFKISNTRHFFYESVKSPEIPIVIDDVDDWKVHEEGSQAELSIDRTNFFGNGQPSLVISFDMEHTKQDIPSSDGWMVITKAEDRELYGTDAFLFDFYYSGHDATILMRVLDDDGEYWHNEVKVSRNSKQTVVMKYTDFSLRTAGTNIFNREFDWQRIHYFEIVFERTFGDGVCVVSNIRAVNYEDYRWMFMDKMDFRGYDESLWTYENYNFNRVISDDGNELTINYGGEYGSFPGYGFQNIPVYKILATGDALRMQVKISGGSVGSTFFFRVTEQDVDRWQFKTPFTYFERDVYKELVIPLKSLRRPDNGSMNGDGAKQFFYILRFNFGLNECYSSGSISIKDLEVITIKDDVEPNNIRTVQSDGVIEDFNNYDLYTQMYYYWEQSSENVDEAMKLDTLHRIGGYRNTYCAEFDYKADMMMATYQLYMDASACVNQNAFQVWFKDGTQKDPKPKYDHLPSDKVAPTVIIQLTMDSGEWYRYTIDCLLKEWNVYTISFDDFELDEGSKHVGPAKPLDVKHIVHMGFGFQYFYYDKDGKPDPSYAIANPVYLDEIKFVEADATKVEEISYVIAPDPTDNKLIHIDDFESLDLTDPDSVFDSWQYAKEHEANLMTPSNDVSSQGGEKSLLMQYQGTTSISYERSTPFTAACSARGFAIDIKWDGQATVYINLNYHSTGTSAKYRATLNASDFTSGAGWYHVELGLNKFAIQSGSGSLSKGDIKNIETISFGLVGPASAEPSQVYIDNMMFSDYLTYTTKNVTVIV